MEHIETYVEEVRKAYAEYWERQGYSFKMPEITYSVGPKFVKIWRETMNSKTGELLSKSIHCFVDHTNGDIYKAASTKQRAKGIRGNIANAKKPLLDFYNYVG